MGGDLPDYTKQITVLLKAEILSQVRQLPWWVKYAPNRIVLLDDIEGMLKWQQGDGTVTKDNTIAHSDSYSLKLSTAATAGFKAIAQSWLPASEGKVALTLYMCPYRLDDSYLRYIEFYLDIRDGTTIHVARIRFVHLLNGSVVDKWQYADTLAPTWADIPNGAMKFDGTNWNKWVYLRLLIDPVNDKYVSLECGSLKLDLSDIPLLASDEETEAGGYLEAYVYTDSDISTDMWIDDILISDTES